MGQRLIVEIIGLGGNVDNVLANCYFHNSGYTSSAAKLTLKAIEQIQKMEYNEEVDDRKLYAIRILESLGARLTESEIEYAHNVEDFNVNTFEMATDRNKGLIAISDDGINETRRWEEARVQINLDTQTIDFDVFMYSDKESFMEQSKAAFELLEEYDFNCDLRAIKFEEFPRVKLNLMELIDNNIYDIIVNTDSYEVVSFIE